MRVTQLLEVARRRRHDCPKRDNIFVVEPAQQINLADRCLRESLFLVQNIDFLQRQNFLRFLILALVNLAVGAFPDLADNVVSVFEGLEGDLPIAHNRWLGSVTIQQLPLYSQVFVKITG